MEKTCAGCGKQFKPRDERQHYCGSIECRQKRRGKWQRNKLITDAAYKENQAVAQKAWRERHPEYWREYREGHPAYLERNRVGQQRRNALRKNAASDGVSAWAPMGTLRQSSGQTARGGRLGTSLQSKPDIAKMDSAPLLKSGTYRIIPLDGSLIAKMDSAIVELSLVSTG